MLFSVRPGATAAQVAEDLRRAGLIRSPARFRLLAESAGLDRRLQSGTYELRATMNAREVLEALANGRARRPDLITIREGWRAEEVALFLEQNGVVSASAFLDVVQGRGGAPLPPGAPSFEGYLFPDSYEFAPGASPQQVLARFLNEFETRVGPELRAKAAERGLSVQELVTLASIIEREAVEPRERGKISAVFHNRLALGMALEADPTVQYGAVPIGSLAPPFGFWKPGLEGADLAIDSPYNTYRFPGLPPGPICSPGLAALEAAANPEPGPWLYFVARGDGSHLFASSLDEHLANVAQVGPRRTGTN